MRDHIWTGLCLLSVFSLAAVALPSLASRATVLGYGLFDGSVVAVTESGETKDVVGRWPSPCKCLFVTLRNVWVCQGLDVIRVDKRTLVPSKVFSFDEPFRPDLLTVTDDESAVYGTFLEEGGPYLFKYDVARANLTNLHIDYALGMVALNGDTVAYVSGTEGHEELRVRSWDMGQDTPVTLPASCGRPLTLRATKDSGTWLVGCNTGIIVLMRPATRDWPLPLRLSAMIDPSIASLDNVGDQDARGNTVYLAGGSRARGRMPQALYTWDLESGAPVLFSSVVVWRFSLDVQ